MGPAQFFHFLKNYTRERVALARASAKRGFTLIEMLMVLAIMVILTTVVMTSQSGFNQSILLTNSAYDLAIALRQAESYGISSKSFLYGGAANTNVGYGIYVSNMPTGSYTFFADRYGGVVSAAPDAKPGDGLYESAQGETVAQYTFTRGVNIARFCGTVTASHTVSCSTDSGISNAAVHIVFTRPNTDAVLTAQFNGSTYPLSSATLYLVSPQGGSRCVTVSNVGEISVSSNCL